MNHHLEQDICTVHCQIISLPELDLINKNENDKITTRIAGSGDCFWKYNPYQTLKIKQAKNHVNT